MLVKHTILINPWRVSIKPGIIREDYDFLHSQDSLAVKFSQTMLVRAENPLDRMVSSGCTLPKPLKQLAADVSKGYVRPHRGLDFLQSVFTDFK
jgi:hypothetical protein